MPWVRAGTEIQLTSNVGLDHEAEWASHVLMVVKTRIALAIGTLVLLIGTPVVRAQDQKANACGCYQDGSGRCFCSKQAKCGCPGECEPNGCEEKRQKAMEKEIQAETRRAQEEDKKRGETKAARPEEDGEDESRPASKTPSKTEARAGAKTAKTAPEPPAAPPRRARPMTAAQKKQLGQLLEAYLGECPDCRVRSVDAVHHEMTGK